MDALSVLSQQQKAAQHNYSDHHWGLLLTWNETHAFWTLSPWLLGPIISGPWFRRKITAWIIWNSKDVHFTAVINRSYKTHCSRLSSSDSLPPVSTSANFHQHLVGHPFIICKCITLHCGDHLPNAHLCLPMPQTLSLQHGTLGTKL